MVDDDYVPPISDDDNDDESFNFVIHKVQQMIITLLFHYL